MIAIDFALHVLWAVAAGGMVGSLIALLLMLADHIADAAASTAQIISATVVVLGVLVSAMDLDWRFDAWMRRPWRQSRTSRAYAGRHRS